ncbi:hypothetical protein P691DRAFT_665621 [Macrolepiota fuliginosa MF-IS2]|uniref:Uncharacterized protein n=1 Tax=Macrolepiota fuliginosa MF-IS2 TaxID=1400762 RepID=A0A9P5XG18_9AGAR|nr:hypothetical protein P691DRAFT_665621 [Macrolepiota fuliginosa MF-IS2]
MWSSRFTPKGVMSPPPPNIGKTFFLGGVLVLGGLTTLYVSMLRSKRKQVHARTNPSYEQVLTHAGLKPIALCDVNRLPSMAFEARSPIPAPVKEHNARHITIEDYKASHDDDGGYGRFQVPPPQRARGDGSGRVYTKSPDYVRNYEKTKARKVEI